MARLRQERCPGCLSAIGPIPGAGDVRAQRTHGCSRCGWSYEAFLRARRQRPPAPEEGGLTLDLESTLTWTGVLTLCAAWAYGLILLAELFLSRGA